jgi:hypothetical protein
LGVVLVLTAVVLGASAFAYWGLRSDTSSAGADRLTRQLFDCAEQGLAVGKQYFAQQQVQSQWNGYLAASSICAPGSNLLTATPPFPSPCGTGTAPDPNYPNGLPYTNTVYVSPPSTSAAQLKLQYTFGLYNIIGTAAGETQFADVDRNVAVYSRCVDMTSGTAGRSRSVSTILNIQPLPSNDYLGVDGHGFRNQGNFNNQ